MNNRLTLFGCGLVMLVSAAANPQNPSRGRGPMAPPPAFSRIKVYDFATKRVREVFSSDGYVESPDFSADGKFIRFTTGAPEGKLLQIPATGGPAVPIGPAGFGWGHDRARSRDGRRDAAGNAN